MNKHITVTLTEDQAKLLKAIIESDLADNSKGQKAFLIRILTKLNAELVK